MRDILVSQWRRRQGREVGRAEIGKQVKRVGKIWGAAFVGRGREVNEDKQYGASFLNRYLVSTVYVMMWCSMDTRGRNTSLSLPGKSCGELGHKQLQIKRNKVRNK